MLRNHDKFGLSSDFVLVLNEVLSLNAQELYLGVAVIAAGFVLNEVLSLNAQE